MWWIQYHSEIKKDFSQGHALDKAFDDDFIWVAYHEDWDFARLWSAFYTGGKYVTIDSQFNLPWMMLKRRPKRRLGEVFRAQLSPRDLVNLQFPSTDPLVEEWLMRAFWHLGSLEDIWEDFPTFQCPYLQLTVDNIFDLFKMRKSRDQSISFHTLYWKQIYLL